jgi:transposase
MAVVRKTSRRELTPTERARIWERYECGHSVTAVAKHFNRPRSTVSSIINRTKKEQRFDFLTKPRPAPPKKTTDRQDRALIRYADANPRCSLKLLATPSKSGIKLGRNTVRKILKEYGKAKRIPRKKPWLRGENRKRRLTWTRVEKKRKRDWNTVYWSDEVTFYVGENNNVFYVTRGANEEFLEKNLKPTFKSRRLKVGVWSCFCGEDMGPLVIIPKGGTMTAQRYIKVLKKHFIPFYRRMVRKYGSEVVMQENNTSWYKAGAVRAFLKAQKVKYLSWPPQSPDLTPIENLWKQIKGRIGHMEERPKTVAQMEQALREVWPQITKESLLILNRSMERRLDTVIKNKGGATKY